MKPTVLLFDIDGTLVTTGGSGRRALQRVFEVLFNRSDACSFPLDGMTDRAIVRRGLQAVGRDGTEEEIDEVLGAYVALLEEEVARQDPARYRLHRGMVEALDAAARRERFAIGLGTGNIKEGARVKLSRVGVYDRFSFGGFGCDHEDRPTLIRIGAERGASLLGVALAECRVVIVGDTPKDVHAAKMLGGECIGVGTGSFSPQQLLEAGADWAFPDLSHPDALAALLEGRGP